MSSYDLVISTKKFKVTKLDYLFLKKNHVEIAAFSNIFCVTAKKEVNSLMCVSILNVYVTLLKCASPSPCSRLKIGVSAFPYAALVLLRTMHKEMESHYTTVYAQMNKKRLLPYASNKGAFCNW